MRNDLQLFLGEDQIPVIRWVNRFGSPVGRDLRFTIPLEAKSKLEANQDATYTLKREDESWDFEVKSLELHTTGTNGVRAIGRVKESKGLGSRPSTAVNIPKLDGSLSEASQARDSKPKKPNLEKLKVTPPKKKKNKKKKRSSTAVGAPLSEGQSDEQE